MPMDRRAERDDHQPACIPSRAATRPAAANLGRSTQACAVSGLRVRSQVRLHRLAWRDICPVDIYGRTDNRALEHIADATPRSPINRPAVGNLRETGGRQPGPGRPRRRGGQHGLAPAVGWRRTLTTRRSARPRSSRRANPRLPGPSTIAVSVGRAHGQAARPGSPTAPRRLAIHANTPILAAKREGPTRRLSSKVAGGVAEKPETGRDLIFPVYSQLPTLILSDPNFSNLECGGRGTAWHSLSP